MLPYYKAEIVDVDGVTILDINDVISVQAARAFNVDGSATVVIPNYYARSLFRLHTRMKLWRYDYDGVPHNFGRTIWFLKKLDHARSDHTITLTFVDAFAMLKGRLIAYTAEGTYGDKTLEEYQIDTYDDRLRADNMMRAFMRENVGDLVLDADRTIPSIVIEQDRSLGAYVEKQAAWAELQSTLTDLAQMSSAKGVDLFYDLIPRDDGTFIFRVWTGARGIDRTNSSDNPLLLSEESGMISDVHEVEDFTDVATFVYVLGFDTSGSQIIAKGENKALSRNDPFGRLEITVSDSDADANSVLADDALGALMAHRPKRVLTATVVENSSLSFGRDIDYGYKVGVQVGATEYDCVLDAISTNWSEDNEQLDLRLNGQVFTNDFNIILWVPPEQQPSPLPDNVAPVVSAGDDQSIDFGATLTLTATATDDGLPDPPAAMTYLWELTGGPASVTFSNAHALVTDVTYAALGLYSFRFTATDGALASYDDLFINIGGSMVNAAPEVSAGADQSIPFGGTAHMDGAARDDGLPNPPATLTITWSQTGGPGVAVITDIHDVNTDVTFPLTGLYSFRLTADDSLLTTYDDMFINIGTAGNDAPEVDAGGDFTIVLGDPMILGGAATDDGLPNPPATLTTTWTMTGGPASVTFDDEHALIATVTYSVAGLYSFRLTADDSELTAYDEVLVNVEPTSNSAPTVNAGLDQHIAFGSPMRLSGIVSDDGLPNPPATLTFHWQMLYGPATVNFLPPNALSTSVVYTTRGLYAFRLTVSDSVLSSQDEVYVNVT